MSHSQILAIGNFSTNHAFVPWIGEKQHIVLEWSSKSFQGTTSMFGGWKIVRKHFKVPLFSNLEDKVLKCVKSS